MDIKKFADSLDEGRREKLSALSHSDAARALSELFDEAELARAASAGDETAMRDILRRVMATPEGRQLAGMLGEAMK